MTLRAHGYIDRGSFEQLRPRLEAFLRARADWVDRNVGDLDEKDEPGEDDADHNNTHESLVIHVHMRGVTDIDTTD
jgi:hypothetical protein